MSRCSTQRDSTTDARPMLLGYRFCHGHEPCAPVALQLGCLGEGSRRAPVADGRSTASNWVTTLSKSDPDTARFLRVLVDKTPQPHRGRDRCADGEAAAGAVRRPGAHHQRRRHRHRIARPTNSARCCPSRCCTTCRPRNCKTGCSPKRFGCYGPGASSPAATAVPSLRFRILHFRDTCNPIPPETLPDRLRAAGFQDVEVKVRAGRQRWRAVKA